MAPIARRILAAPNKIVNVAPPMCTLGSPGWTPVHKLEADAKGQDPFANQTCEVLGNLASLFIPAGVGDQNNVHIFFPAGGVQGDVNNGVVTHAMRVAANAAGWILIAVRAGFANPNDQIVHEITSITARQVVELLAAHGRPARIDKLRLSSHSRGSGDLKATLDSKLLVAAGASAPVVSPSVVDRVISFDSDSNHFFKAVTDAGIDPGVVFGYWATVFPETPPFDRKRLWTIPDSQTIELGFESETGPMPVKKGVRAVEYCRLVDDAMTLRQDVMANLSPDVLSDVKSLALPPLGTFTSRGGQFQSWCRSHSALIDKLVGNEVKRIKNSELFRFVTSNDLARIGRKSNVNPGIWHHHLFVSEFAHEVTDVPLPQPG